MLLDPYIYKLHVSHARLCWHTFFTAHTTVQHFATTQHSNAAMYTQHPVPLCNCRPSSSSSRRLPRTPNDGGGGSLQQQPCLCFGRSE